MSSDVEYVKRKFAEERQSCADALTSGRINDIAEYKRLCGVIQGLNRAEEIITDLAKKKETQDE